MTPGTDPLAHARQTHDCLTVVAERRLGDASATSNTGGELELLEQIVRPVAVGRGR
jgi:hypothetical protein